MENDDVKNFVKNVSLPSLKGLLSLWVLKL